MNDGVYTLVQVTKEMLSHIKIVADVDCFSLCDIIRLEFTNYLDYPINLHPVSYTHLTLPTSR